VRIQDEGERVKDLTIALANRPSALAEMGEALDRAWLSIEGGGVFVVKVAGVAHFLFADGEAASRALEAAGIPVLAVREVLVQRLRTSRANWGKSSAVWRTPSSTLRCFTAITQTS
jgi:hypothetical protein